MPNKPGAARRLCPPPRAGGAAEEPAPWPNAGWRRGTISASSSSEAERRFVPDRAEHDLEDHDLGAAAIDENTEAYTYADTVCGCFTTLRKRAAFAARQHRDGRRRSRRLRAWSQLRRLAG